MGFTAELDAATKTVVDLIDRVQAQAPRRDHARSRPRRARGPARSDQFHPRLHREDGPADQRDPEAVARGAPGVVARTDRHDRAGRRHPRQPGARHRGAGRDGRRRAAPRADQRPGCGRADLFQPGRERDKISRARPPRPGYGCRPPRKIARGLYRHRQRPRDRPQGPRRASSTCSAARAVRISPAKASAWPTPARSRSGWAG